MRDAMTNAPRNGIAGTLIDCARAVGRLLGQVRIHRRERMMRVCESLQLGDRRFLAIVEVDRERLLIAGTAQNITLLQKLDPRTIAAEVPQAAAEPAGFPAEITL